MAPNTQIFPGAPTQAPQSGPPGLVGSTQTAPMGARDTRSYDLREGTSHTGFPNHPPMDEDSNMESQPHEAESSSRKRRRATSVGPWEFTAQCDVLHQSGCSICDDYRSHRMRAEARKNLDFEAALAERNQWRVRGQPYDLGFAQGRLAGSTDIEFMRVSNAHTQRLLVESEARERELQHTLTAVREQNLDLERQLHHQRANWGARPPQMGMAGPSREQGAPPHYPTGVAGEPRTAPYRSTAQIEGYQGYPGSQTRSEATSSSYTGHQETTQTGQGYLIPDLMYESPDEEEWPPEIKEAQRLMDEVDRDPTGPAYYKVRDLVRAANERKPHLRSDLDHYVLRMWRNPNSAPQKAVRAEEKQREAATRPARGRGAPRGAGSTTTPASTQGPTGLMPQPGLRAPVEVQHEYYRQHPQALPRWLPGGRGRTWEGLSPHHRATVDAWLYIRRIAPENKEERRSYMDLVQQILSRIKTLSDWQQLIARNNLLVPMDSEEFRWPSGTPTPVNEETVRAHLARQGFTTPQLTQLLSWVQAAGSASTRANTSSGTTSAFGATSPPNPGPSTTTTPVAGPSNETAGPSGVQESTPSSWFEQNHQPQPQDSQQGNPEQHPGVP